MRRIAHLAVMLAVLSACAYTGDEPAGADPEGITGGTVTGVRPEIGNAFCTATLVRPNWAVTAGHCGTFFNQWGPDRATGLDEFAIADSAGRYGSIHGQYAAYSINVGATPTLGYEDVMLVRLQGPVSPSLATPGSFVTSSSPVPHSGDTITVFGNGIPMDGYKQYLVTTYGLGSYPFGMGDSGGPWILGNAIANPSLPTLVFGVTSTTSGAFGDLRHLSSYMTAVINYWDIAADLEIGASHWCTHATGEFAYMNANGWYDNLPDAICHDTSTGMRWLARNSYGLIANDPAETSTINFCSGSSTKFLTGDVNGDTLDDSICHDMSTGVTWVDYAVRAPPLGQYFGYADWSIANGWCHAFLDQLYTGDFNGDGKIDLLCHGLASGALAIDYADASGHYGGTDWSGWSYCTWSDMAAADMDNNGYTDLVCHNRTAGNVSIAYNSPSTRFTSIGWTSPTLGWNPFCQDGRYRFAVGDYNADGLADLYCADTTHALNPIGLFHQPLGFAPFDSVNATINAGRLRPRMLAKATPVTDIPIW